MTTDRKRLIKGTLLLARMKYLKTFGPEVVETVLHGLSEEDATQIRALLLPSSWYPVELLRGLEDRMAAALNHTSRRSLFLEIGRSAASANLTGTGLQRAFVRPGDPHFVLGRAPSIYASYFTDGHRTYLATGEHSAVIRTTRPFADAHQEECLITTGWLSAAIEISGGRDVKVVELQCGVRGDPCCEFHCSWRVQPAAAASIPPPASAAPTSWSGASSWRCR